MMQPGRFTELFFLDEATAFAAGHRPCALCRREDYNRFGEIWRRIHPGQIGADAVDAQLHVERIDTVTQSQRRHRESWDRLPDGAFVLCEGRPHLVLGDQLLAWTPAGYTDRHPRRQPTCEVTRLRWCPCCGRVGSGGAHGPPSAACVALASFIRLYQ